MFLVLFIHGLLAGVYVSLFLKPNNPALFEGPCFMFWTVEHPSIPFWYFAVLESFFHPPARNPLGAHQREMVSVNPKKAMSRPRFLIHSIHFKIQNDIWCQHDDKSKNRH